MQDSATKIQTCRQMLELDPCSRAFALLAEELCAAGRWEEAVEVCKKGILFHPDHFRSRVLLAVALMELGDAGQCERVLLGVVRDIRKNSVIFKLLSELSEFSGDKEIAGEYARIYEALEATEGTRSKIDLPSPERPEPAAFQPGKEALQWTDFKTGAIEQPQGPDTDTEAAEAPAGRSLKMGDGSPVTLESILEQLAQRIDERAGSKAPPGPLLSEEDRNMLKQRLLAAMNA